MSPRRPDRSPEAFWVGDFVRVQRRFTKRLTRGGLTFAGQPLAGRSLINLPGKTEIDYRIGVYDTFLADMLVHVESQRIPDGPYRGTIPLAKLNLEEPGNWVLALLHAWAVVGDVLTFYQERIVNEFFLRTATEALSVRELLYTIGYRPHPGMAAVTPLAFRVSAARGMPEEVILKPGARVQSLPVGGRPPQLFETDQVLRARAEWNRLEPRVARVRRRPPLTGGATDALVAGSKGAVERGALLLVEGDLGTGLQRWLRTVEKVQSKVPEKSSASPVERLLAARQGAAGREPPPTGVHWSEPLDAARSEIELAAPGLFVFRRRGSLFGAKAPEWDSLPVDVRRRYQPLEGGVAVSTDGGESWRQINQGLPAKPIHALLAAADGILFAATAAGLFRAVGEAPWAALDSLGRQPVEAVAGDGAGTVWAGSATGSVLRSGDGGDSWEPVTGQRPSGPLSRLTGRLLRRPPGLVRLPRGPVHALLSYPGGRGRLLLAATDKGIFSSRDQGDGWRSLNRGLPGDDPTTGLSGVAVQALAVDSLGALWAGTAKGVFRARRPGARWRPVNQGLPGTDPKTGLATSPVTALVAYDDRRSRRRRLVAGMAGGVFHRSGRHGVWQPTGEGLPGIDPVGGGGATPVAALAVRADPQALTTEVWAATARGLFRSSDHGETWVPVELADGATALTALTVGALGEVVAASPFAGFALDQWPDFHLRGRQIDLSTVQTDIVVGGWLALTESPDDGPPRLGIYRVEAVSTVRREDFRLASMVTRVIADRDEGLAAFDLRRTVVHFASQPLALWSREVALLEPLDPQRIELEPLESPLRVGRAVIVTGRPLRLTLAEGAPPAVLQPARPGAAAQPIEPGDVLTLCAPPRRDGARLCLDVRHPDAGRGVLEVAASAVRWLPCDEAVEPLAQRTAVAGFTHQTASLDPSADGAARVSVVTLEPPLVHGLDPLSAGLLANIAQASQGETVVEHLSGGKVPRPHRSLTLARPPLTYLPAGTPEGVVSTLEVRVDGTRWEKVHSLREAGSQDRVYVVRQDLEDRPHLVFGDGREGARLPRGNGNVTTTYRSGMWLDPLPVGHLNLLQTRPLGLQGATNPLPVEGATPPELPGERRERAPWSTRVFGRIVSLPDCHDFVASFPGIERTSMARFQTAAGPVVQLTVAGFEGRAVAGALMRRLDDAVATFRVPGPPVRIDSYQRVEVELAVRVRSAPEELPEQVEERVRAHLDSTLGFAQTRFGQTLTASAIIVGILGVDGVVDARLTTFHRAGAPPAVADAIEARPASWDPDHHTARPAELLMVDLSERFRLEVTP